MRIVKRTVEALKTFAARFVSESRGNVAMIFALALPPMIFMTLGGVDIHRTTTVRQNLQDALDAATLAAARSQYTDDARITEVGLASLNANLAPFADVALTTGTTFRLNRTTGAVVANARVNVDTLVADIVLPPYGKLLDDQIQVGAHSEVLRSNKRIEVALVIDNTGSMSGAKLTNTKQAAIDLINRLQAAQGRSIDQEAIKISLVPFSQTVRISPGGSNTVPSYMTNANNHTGSNLFNNKGRFGLFSSLKTTWGGCVEARGAPYDIRDTAPISNTRASLFVPYFAPDSPDRDAYPNDGTWRNWNYENDYVADGITNGQPNVGSSTARDTQWFNRQRRWQKYSSTPFFSLNTARGPNRGCDLVPLIRLTNDYEALRRAVGNMVATGNTNVPLGAMWGWHTLSPVAPFGDGRAYGTPRLNKIIIIMTDGENVMGSADNPNASTYSALGYVWQNRLGITSGSDADRRKAMDDRFDSPTAGKEDSSGRSEDLCWNMKKPGVDIEVYTVAVQVDSQAQALLRRCATDDDHYFPVDSATGIGAAFDRIAGAIENLRISR